MTYANISHAQTELGFRPRIALRRGLCQFAMWYSMYYDTPLPDCTMAGSGLYASPEAMELRLEPATTLPGMLKQLQAAQHKHEGYGHTAAAGDLSYAVAVSAAAALSTCASAADAPSGGGGSDLGLDATLLMDAAKALTSSVGHSHHLDCRKLQLETSPPHRAVCMRAHTLAFCRAAEIASHSPGTIPTPQFPMPVRHVEGPLVDAARHAPSEWKGEWVPRFRPCNTAQLPMLVPTASPVHSLVMLGVSTMVTTLEGETTPVLVVHVTCEHLDPVYVRVLWPQKSWHCMVLLWY